MTKNRRLGGKTTWKKSAIAFVCLGNRRILDNWQETLNFQNSAFFPILFTPFYCANGQCISCKNVYEEGKKLIKSACTQAILKGDK